jgi:plastocyanin
VHRRDLLAYCGVLGAVPLAGCSNDEGTTTATATASQTPSATTTRTSTPLPTVADEPRVIAAAESFTPSRLRVAPETTVTWENTGSDTHTVQSDVFNPEVATEWSYYSLDLVSGNTASYTFDDRGIYEYYCTVHGQDTMCGVVLVGDVRYTATLPCEA